LVLIKEIDIPYEIPCLNRKLQYATLDAGLFTDDQNIYLKVQIQDRQPERTASSFCSGIDQDSSYPGWNQQRQRGGRSHGFSPAQNISGSGQAEKLHPCCRVPFLEPAHGEYAYQKIGTGSGNPPPAAEQRRIEIDRKRKNTVPLRAETSGDQGPGFICHSGRTPDSEGTPGNRRQQRSGGIPSAPSAAVFPPETSRGYLLPSFTRHETGFAKCEGLHILHGFYRRTGPARRAGTGKPCGRRTHCGSFPGNESAGIRAGRHHSSGNCIARLRRSAFSIAGTRFRYPHGF